MTNQEMIAQITESIQLDGNLRKVLLASILASLPNMGTDQLVQIMQTLSLPTE